MSILTKINDFASTVANYIKLSKHSFTTLTSGTIDLSTGSVFYLNLTEPTTISFTNLPPAGTCQKVVLVLKNANTYAVTWPSNIHWIYGTEPTIEEQYFYVEFVVTGNDITA